MWNGNDRLTALKQSPIVLEKQIAGNAVIGTDDEHALQPGTDPMGYQFGDSCFYSYQVNDDSRGELFADIQLLQDINRQKTLYRRQKMWGVKSREKITNSTFQFSIHLPENSPPRSLMIFVIEETKQPVYDKEGLRQAYGKPTGVYFLKMDKCVITVSAIHNGRIRTLQNISFDDYGSSEVQEFLKAFERHQLAGKLFGAEDNMFTYKQWLDQIPAIIIEYDSSQADIVATARTGQIQSVLQVTLAISGTRSWSNESRLQVIAFGDEYIRKLDSVSPYQIITGREVLGEGFLQQGLDFTSQNTGNVARLYGFDAALERARG